ncbi:carbohydrate ABC transporter permease [Compostimonas suwonensis]|uniref:Multiple sugar transport system permease protein n=1 Tax=Compostimonas suwonensis TaxID=1048394 RepID=A0A2M9BVZ3_9MICO|nr:carbohydrate ABC transporter permease [Compostimonas suwonensis]PJJ62084.1 multiple sugar transport system permease protein [Compostimonas suwonensis]
MTAAATSASSAADRAARTRRPGSAYRRKATLSRVLFHIGMIVLVVVVLYPGVWLLGASIKPSNDIVGNVSVLTSEPTFDNFVTALSGIAGIPSLVFFWNSLVLAVGSVVGIVLSSTVTAYAFARIRFAGRGVWFNLMIGTLLLPFQVVIIPQYILFQKMGVIDTFIPLLLGKFLATEAFFVFLLVQFMRNIPRELDEAARIDGAGHFRTFWSVMLPLTRPAIVSASIFAFIWSWNDFLGPLLYLSSPSNYTVSLALRTFVDQTAYSDFGAMMAMSVLAILPVLVFFTVFQRYIVEGVATQGLKG